MEMGSNYIPMIASIFCLFSIALGAFGAHSLNDFLRETNHLDTFETASKYLMYGGLLGLIESYFSIQNSSSKQKNAAIIMLASTFIFAGALYLICFTGVKTFGAIAPIGGLGMMISLVYFTWGFKHP